MEPPSQRHRTSSAAHSRPITATPIYTDIRGLLKSLTESLPPPSARPSLGTLQVQCDDLRRLRQLLIDTDDQGQAGDAFRHARGFTALLDALRSVSGFYEPSRLSRDERTEFFELFRAVLQVLSEALNEHSGNKRYFAKRVEGGGWRALEQAIASTGICGTVVDGEVDDQTDLGYEQLFGLLFAFALGEEMLSPMFRDIGKNLVAPKAKEDVKRGENRDADLVDGQQPEVEIVGSGAAVDAKNNYVQRLRSHIRGFISGTEVVRNPDIFPILLNFWALLSADSKGTTQNRPAMSTAPLIALEEIVASSTHNKAAIHCSGTLSTVLRYLLDERTAGVEQELLRSLANSLLPFGVNSLDDAYKIFRKASRSSDIAELLLSGMRTSRGPPFIQFDLSLNGYSSVELPTLGPHQFPPTSTGGYTMSAWIRVDSFDVNCHTTVFGAYDPSQTCFVLAYLEKDTRHFILQTSITSSKPSVRFRSTVFRPGIWYHVAVVHRRPKATSSSKASLFVNGEFAEQVKCPYPVVPQSPAAGENFPNGMTYGAKLSPVQAFLGTPQDLASRLGRNVVSSKWSLASFHLFEDALSDELVAVYQKLGPRYHGNFQDSLGSFQTYRASAELNLYNEALHPGKEEKSEIVAAIRGRAKDLLPESKLLMSISPTAVMDDDDRNNIDESQLVRSLSRNAARQLKQYTQAGGNAIVINAAVPSINAALTQPHGVAILTAEPIVVVPQSLDDCTWRIGGCAAVGLKLVELAQTKCDIVRAVEVLFESVEENWRNSEAMEKEKGFSVLAALLREKLGYGTVFSNIPGRPEPVSVEGSDREEMSLKLLKAILRFVGYDEKRPEESIIINPLAYRILLVDFDMWRKSPLTTQKLYYSQFVHFSRDSKHHHFNCRRLTRMRIARRLMDALRGESFTEDIFPDFLSAFRCLVKANPSSETFRGLALFITFALHDSRAFVTRTLRSKTSTLRLKSTSTPPTNTPLTSTPRSISPARDMGRSAELSRGELGVRILELYSEMLCDRISTVDIRKFAKTVTNKWLLYLLAENEPRVVILGAKILSRLLVVHGSSYVKKFADKTGGFTIMKQRLRNWWNLPAVWLICFATLFGIDVSQLNFGREFELYTLVESFLSGNATNIIYPEIVPVITAMLETGLKAVLSKAATRDSSPTPQSHKDLALKKHLRQRSLSLGADASSINSDQHTIERAADNAAILQTVIQFLADLHQRSPKFRDFATSSNYVQDLLWVLYPVVVTSDSVSAETELHSRGSTLSLEGQDVLIRPRAISNDQRASIVRTTTVEPPPSPSSQKNLPLRRGSSFILVSSDRPDPSPSSARLNPVMSPKKTSPTISLKIGHSLVEALLETVIGVYQDQIFNRKEFPGFGLFLKVPPGFQEHQAYFESYVLRHAMSSLSNSVQLDQKLLCEPRVLTNLSRYALYMAEAVFEGWFIDGAEALLDFVGTLLEYLQRPDIARIKSVRLCTQAIATIRTVFMRVTLLRLSELDDPSKSHQAAAFLDKMTYWQTVILGPENSEDFFLRLICYLLYTHLVSVESNVRLSAANFWRMMLVQKPAETSILLSHGATSKQKQLSQGFMKLMELDNEAFLDWIDDHRADLDDFFFGAMSKSWEDYVAEENKRTQETAKNRVARRREKLRHWQLGAANEDDVWNRHEISTTHWRANIYSSERLKYQRSTQDQQDNLTFTATTYETLNRVLLGPCELFGEENLSKWQLDETEGRNRMRLRILPDRRPPQTDYQPKRQASEGAKNRLKLDTSVKSISSKDAVGATPSGPQSNSEGNVFESNNRPRSTSQSSASGSLVNEDEFEIIDDPKEDEDGFEDKNRKVMRSLQHGDQVQHVCNVSRIVGLDACEGLLILGKDSLYLMDNYFQRSDGEIVGVWQAPSEERDPYLQMIAGRQTTTARKPQVNVGEQTSRNWRWAEVISISKRRFLFRDVAIETFFTDGRSYLLTAISPSARDELYTRLIARAPQVTNPSSSLQPEDMWRLESLRNPDDAPQTLGSKFANVFNSTSSNPATRRWMKGEISNFHYLMLVNTMAGRTFNDLTQYPVFPWVLADYSSEELDLTDPRSFRDLSKPMGCQHASREAEFRERYHSFWEMADHNTPPFHYGTHYSSAMIVASYLIRLQPFVQSYLLLQGGNFDHADRMFYSIEKAWLSASRDNMTDVRELTPEFFYLPEFLVNMNGYNFGTRQGTGERIDNVILPPWAKGDPKIFIAKNREALESPYVSKNLHRWIDLVFGFKQRGEAAIEATNVFHHLSYHGAKDLDTIDDPIERLATIGIIHNFGQTPHQVFQRSHVQREETSLKYKRLDNSSESLTRLPFTLIETGERVSSMLFSANKNRLFCSAAFRLNIPPSYDRFMEWGFADNSVRFYATDSKKLLGVFEHLHQGQISCATFVDSKTLITAGTDCTIAAWTVVFGKVVDLQPKVNLFGHRTPVTTLATSRAFGAFLSASTDGKVFLWDLNRSEFVRELGTGGAHDDGEVPVQCAKINSVSGHVALCCGAHVRLYTLNGALLLDQNVCDEGLATSSASGGNGGNGGPAADVVGDDYVASCAFYEGIGNEWLERELLFTGHRRGVVKIWSVEADERGRWRLVLVKRLHSVDTNREDGANYAAAVSCILPTAQVLYTGDDEGRVVSF
ncbi:hypothetical protein BDY21DRAFT_354308 [Lineolata rhizophorae]|uniref:Beach-domain-containing protein n=1 Tax=Lineolata rhizophorae TaxID=578093 RepID=A0A6A6NR44_9PEZI|nr:hypothetical protein BDY21DRAFT_354308 [Lineolata rhizophorae]